VNEAQTYLVPEHSPALHELLRSPGDEGFLVDSSGFTIDHLKAPEKEGRFDGIGALREMYDRMA
jgi:hypothetical protein